MEEREEFSHVREEHWSLAERRGSRQERKRLRKGDRSKFKKSDCDQRDRQAEGSPRRGNGSSLEEATIEGRVVWVHSEEIKVEVGGSERELLSCVLLGTLKKEDRRQKNLIAVGDKVLVREGEGAESGQIVYIFPRSTVLSRSDNLLHRREQIVATNVEQLFVTLSVVDPPLRHACIDRYLIAARRGGMDVLLVVNKVDLLEKGGEGAEREEELLQEVERSYRGISLPVVRVSARDPSSLCGLAKRMEGRASVFSGPSGTGKSSLINALLGSRLVTGKTVGRTGKGAHTTTMAQILHVPNGGWVIDTPGLRSFGLWQLTLDEIEGYFDEIHRCGSSCHFSNCTHVHEEGCAVLTALQQGTLAQMRYASYRALRDELSSCHRRR